MALLILLMIVAAMLVALFGGIIMTWMFARRLWHWMGPVGKLALLLLIVLSVFDVSAAGDKAASPSRSHRDIRSTKSALPLKQSSPELPAEPSLPKIVIQDGTAPAWTEHKPGEWNSAQSEAEVTVYAGPHWSRAKCEAELDVELAKAVDDYIRTEIAPQSGTTVDVPRDFIRANFVKEFHESVAQRQVVSTADPQEMVELYALVKIDAAGRQQLRDLWREAVIRGRMKTTGLALAGVLGVLTMAWATLRRAPQSKNQEAHQHAV